jgi:hypothetical protein
VSLGRTTRIGQLRSRADCVVSSSHVIMRILRRPLSP